MRPLLASVPGDVLLIGEKHQGNRATSLCVDVCPSNQGKQPPCTLEEAVDREETTKQSLLPPTHPHKQPDMTQAKTVITEVTGIREATWHLCCLFDFAGLGAEVSETI